MVKYFFETELVSDFLSNLAEFDNDGRIVNTSPEFPHTSGRVDIIGLNVNGELISFEAKLTKWKKALNQAYRNTAFSHFSYVVMPLNRIRPALKERQQFIDRNVGLCTVSNNNIEPPPKTILHCD